MVKYKNIRFASVLCCGVSILAMPTVAFAQADDAGGYSGKEIIVTATRSETNLQDTPMAVDVVSGDDLQKLNIFDTKEIQNLSPGLELTNTTGRNNTATLRGISFDPDGGTSPAVEVFYNEIPTNANTVFTAIYDLGQVEILRGPQGLFRGKTSPAGSLLFGTKRADLGKVDGYLQAAGTTENAMNFQGGVSVPIIQDKVAVRISGLYDENDVAGVKTIDGRKSSSETYSGRISLTLQPTDNWTTYVMYQYLKSKLDPYIVAFGPGNTIGANMSGPALSIGDRTSVLEGTSHFENKSHLLTVNSNYDFGGAELVWNLGYQYTALKQYRDLDIGNAVPNFERIQDLFTSFDYLNTELRLQSKGDSRFTWSVSADYHDNTTYSPLHWDQHSYSPDGIAGPTCSLQLGGGCYERASIDLTIKDKGYGLAGTVGYELTDNVKITGGIRYAHSKVARDQLVVINPIVGGYLPLGAFTDPTFATYPNGDWLTYLSLCDDLGADSAIYSITNRYTFNTPGTKPFISVDQNGVCGVPQETHFRNKNDLWSGGANISWEVNPDLTVYASYGRTQRAGPAAVGVSADVGDQYKQAKTETADGFELGLKTNLLDRKMNLNVALFYQKFKNFLSYQSDLFAIEPSGRVVFLAIPTNGDADTRGIELQWAYRPTRNIDLGLNASYVKSKYTSPVYCNVFDANGDPVLPPAPATVGEGIDQTATCQGQPLADSPKFTFTTNAEFRIPTNSGFEPFIRGNLNFRPGFKSTISNYEYRDFAKVDLFIGVRSDDRAWEVSAFAKNLLNQDRLKAVSASTYRTQATDGSFLDSGYRTGSISSPREFGLSAKYSF